MVAIKDLVHNRSALQASYLYVSTILGVILGMAVSVVNTRALPPAEYGDVSYVNNFANFFAGILLVGYFISGSRLLAIARTPSESAQIKGAIMVVLAIVAVGQMAVMTACGLIHEFVLHKSYAYLFFTTLPVCMAPLLLNYVNTTAQGDNSIGMIALGRLLPSLFYLLVAWWIYHQFGATPQRMLWLRNGIQVLILAWLIISNKPSFINLRESLRKLNDENRKYGLHVYFGSLANVSVPYIAGVSLGLFAPNNVNVAFFTLAITISTPLSMAPNVIATTFFKKFASQFSISSKVLAATLAIAGISLIGFCIIVFQVVDILYDSSYQVVAIYACFLAIGSTANGLGDVFNRFLGAHGQGKQLRNGAWISGAVSIAGYTIGVYFLELNGAIITRILASVVYLICMLIYYARFTKNTEQEYASTGDTSA